MASLSIHHIPGRPLAIVHEFLTPKEQAGFTRVSKKLNTALEEHRARFLDPKKRPEAIQKEIDAAYQRIIGRTNGWGYNGSEAYGICGIDDSRLIKKIIQEAPPSRKEPFVFMDVGGGDEATWSEEQAKFINSQKDLREDIRVIFISLKGERHAGQSCIQDGRCTRYHLGSFKIEEIQDYLIKAGFPADMLLDGAFTNWCLRHLVDPVGTALQIINMLRPQTGVFLGDGFFALYPGKDPEECLRFPSSYLSQFLAALKIPFLTRKGALHGMNQFILRRPNENPCELPWRYEGLYRPKRSQDNASGCVTIFELNQPYEKGLRNPDNASSSILFGSRRLYEELYKKELMSSHSIWKPIRKSESIRENSLLHKAVTRGDLDAVKGLVRKDNIDDPNAKGETPVALAIRGMHDDILQFLVEKGANVRLVDNRSTTPLQKAVESARSEIYVPLLLKSGADMNVGRILPLDRAVELIKMPMISLLQREGARSRSSEELLSDPAKLRFQPPELYYLSDHPLKNYVANIANWLKIGDCVVLRQQWENVILYQGSTDPSLKDVRVIGVNVDDDVDLAPVLELLQKEGYYPRATPFAKEIGFMADIPHNFTIDLSPGDLTTETLRDLR